MTVSRLFCGVILLAVATVTSGQWFAYNSRIPELTKNDRPLPTLVKPTNYNLKLYPDILEGTFFGMVTIDLVCEQDTKTIVLHAHPDLNITQLYVKNGEEDISIVSTSRDNEQETISLSLENELERDGLYQAHFEFSGLLIMEDEYQRRGPYAPMGGFFRGSYMNSDSMVQKWYAGTNMVPKSPRKVFPCFDEPSFKATYQISVAHSINMTALSVTPIESTDLPVDDVVWDNFETTPPISTFSVNIFIADFEKTVLMNESSMQDNFTMLYHHRRLQVMDDMPKANSQDISHAFEYLQDYLGVKYPLQKLDIVGLPSIPYQLASSSPGLILSHEYKMMDRFADKFRDLVDQWFVHIITPMKWNEFNITDIISHYLSTNIMENTGVSAMWFTMRKESIYNTISFGMDVYGVGYDPWQPYEVMIGSWFLQMLSSSLTENTLRTAFGNLISNNMYGTYTPEDLWAEITKQAHIDGTLPKSITVETLARTWMKRNRHHFPVLTVTRHYDNDTASLEQHIFTKKINHSLTEEEKKMLWWIPVTYLTPCRLKASAAHPVAWLQEEQLNIHNLPDADSFIIVNPTDSGMFFVNYDEHNWNLLTQSLMSSEEEIPTSSRRKLVQDALFLAAGGELSYKTALSMTVFLFNETDYSVWLPFLEQIKLIQNICYFTPVEDKFNNYVRELVAILFNSMSQPDFQSQSIDYIIAYHKARDVLDRVGYQRHIDEINKYTNPSLPTFSYYDNDTKLTLYCPESLKNISNDWSSYVNQLRQFINYRDYGQMGICKCPGYTNLVQGVLNGTMDEDTAFTSYDFNDLIRLITGCQSSHIMTFDFFVDHFDVLRQKFYFVKDIWNGLVENVMSKVRTRDQLDRLTELYEEKKDLFGYSKPVVKRALSEASRLVEMKESSLQEIELWLDEILPSLRQSVM